MINTIFILRWLWRTSDGVRGSIFLRSLLGVFRVLFCLFFIYLSKKIIDQVIIGESNIYGIAWMMGFVLLGQLLSGAFGNWLHRKIDIQAQNRIRELFFKRLLKSNWNSLEKYHTGDVLNRMIVDISKVTQLYVDTVPNLLIWFVQITISFLFLYSMDIWLAVILIFILPIFMLLSRIYVNRMRKIVRRVRQHESKIQSLMQEGIQHRMIIKTLERNCLMLDILRKEQYKLEKRVKYQNQYVLFSRSLVSMGFSGGYLTAFLWGVGRLSAGEITFGTMTAFLQLVGQIQRPFGNIAQLIPEFINSLTASERLMELEKLPIEDDCQSIILKGHLGVQLFNISFAYNDRDKNIMDNLSFNFMPSTRTAILGETGVGKTTLIRILLALVKPQKGKILVYNDEIQYELLSTMRGNFVYVPQGNTLLSGTIRFNLLLGNPNATEEEMWQALFIAAADFVKEQPMGLDSKCEEFGGRLSEGQAQRIAIARALLRPGKILLFDEATSALDEKTEQLFLDRIKIYLSDKTLIFVTHKKSVAEQCDRILKM